MKSMVSFKRSKHIILLLSKAFHAGPIIRITPRELSVSDLDFLDTIYAPGPHAKRNKDLEKVKALGINTSIGGAVDHDLHRKRRESLNPFFSKKSVLHIAPQIQERTAQLGNLFMASKEIVNLSDLYFAFASEQVLLLSTTRNALWAVI